MKRASVFNLRKLVRPFALAGVIIAAVICTGCQSAQKDTVSSVCGDWTVASMEKNGVRQEIIAVPLEIRREGDKLALSGNAGVNHFGGTVRMEGTSVYADDGFMLTKMMGSPEEMAFEDAYVAAWNEPGTLKVSRDGAAETLVFTSRGTATVITYRRR